MIRSRKQQIIVDWEKRTVDYSEGTGRYFAIECFKGTEDGSISLFNVYETQPFSNPNTPNESNPPKRGCNDASLFSLALPVILALGFMLVTLIIIFCNLV